MSKVDGHLFPYHWRLSDGFPSKGICAHGKKVFGTFICGGGSTMGYKLAGYDHLGGVEIDPRTASVYEENHHPKLLFVEDIRAFNARKSLPEELFDLDILDGSPPCSTFSMAGHREKAWGKEKKFDEGQKKQRLDDLVFEYCETIDRLRPKVCLLENVSGLVKGNAKAYSRKIFEKISKSGYRVQAFLLNASRMGVPQVRERVFFIGLRNDLAKNLPRLTLDFRERPINAGEFVRLDEAVEISGNKRVRSVLGNMKSGDRSLGDITDRTEAKKSLFTWRIVQRNEPFPTIAATQSLRMILYENKRFACIRDILDASSFPQDYKCNSEEKLGFLCGMSVPPVMTAQIAWQIYLQWLSKIS